MAKKEEHKEHEEVGINEPAQCVSRVLWLFADEVLEFIFCFRREESMATPAEHEALLFLPQQPSPSSVFENFPLLDSREM